MMVFEIMEFLIISTDLWLAIMLAILFAVFIIMLAND